MKNQEFTQIPAVSIQHYRVYSSLLPFCICNQTLSCPMVKRPVSRYLQCADLLAQFPCNPSPDHARHTATALLLPTTRTPEDESRPP